MENCLWYWSQELRKWLDHYLWRTTCSSSHNFHKAEDRPSMSSVQQSLCLRFRTPKSHAVPWQDRQHLVAVQRHRPTRRTSAAAAAYGAVQQCVLDVKTARNFQYICQSCINGKATTDNMGLNKVASWICYTVSHNTNTLPTLHIYYRLISRIHLLLGCKITITIFTGWMLMIHSTLVFNIVYIHPHTQPFNSPLNGTNWGSRYQKKHSPTHTHEEGFTYTVLYTLGKNGKVLLQIGRPFVGSYKITSKKTTDTCTKWEWKPIFETNPNRKSYLVSRTQPLACFCDQKCLKLPLLLPSLVVWLIVCYPHLGLVYRTDAHSAAESETQFAITEKVEPKLKIAQLK